MIFYIEPQSVAERLSVWSEREGISERSAKAEGLRLLPIDSPKPKGFGYLMKRT